MFAGLSTKENPTRVATITMEKSKKLALKDINQHFNKFDETKGSEATKIEVKK